MNTAVDPALGKEIGGPGRTYFDDVIVDNMLDALLELSASLWACQDRAYVLERVLETVLAESHGRPNLAQLVESWQPKPEDQTQRRAAREQYIAQVYRAFARRPHQGAQAREETP